MPARRQHSLLSYLEQQGQTQDCDLGSDTQARKVMLCRTLGPYKLHFVPSAYKDVKNQQYLVWTLNSS